MVHIKRVVISIVLATSAVAVPVRREVPQEHSHEQFLTSISSSLNINNPDEIVDPVFGLLGNAAASQGQGKITDTDCLQQATADQAFTNAKAAGDIDGQVSALIYRALERNTGSVGLASAACTSIQAVNPEIAAVSQHQDPASAGAAEVNKAIVLALAQQIQAIGGDPQLALKSGTFAPGNPNDNTGKGNTCDDANDAVGCIFTQNLLVEDATADEINAAASGGASNSASDATPTSVADTNAASCPATVTVAVAASATASATTAAASSSSGLNFGNCTNPSVEFGAGLDGRKATEFSFINVDQTEFQHGSALNPDIIFQFTCDNLVNNCGLTNADATVQTCRSARTTASALGKTGAAADSFNSALGFNTDFAKLDAAGATGSGDA